MARAPSWTPDTRPSGAPGPAPRSAFTHTHDWSRSIRTDWIIGFLIIVLLLGVAVAVARMIDRRTASRSDASSERVAPTEGARQRVRTVQQVPKGLVVAVVFVGAIGVVAETFDLGSGPLLAIVLVTAVLAAFSGTPRGSDVVAGISIVLEGQYYEDDWLEVKRHGIRSPPAPGSRSPRCRPSRS